MRPLLRISSCCSEYKGDEERSIQFEPFPEWSGSQYQYALYAHENRIGGNLNRRFAIIIQWHNKRNLDTKCSKQAYKPNNFSTMDAKLRYFTLAKLRKIVHYFFNYHEIREEPKLIKYTCDWAMSVGTWSQSASQKTVKMESKSEERRIPCPRECLRYRTTLVEETIKDNFGECMNWLNVWIKMKYQVWCE